MFAWGTEVYRDYIIGILWGYLGDILRLYWENGKEHGKTTETCPERLNVTLSAT